MTSSEINNIPEPHPKMPKDIQKIYCEACLVAKFSLRSSCLLLRLCVEDICDKNNAKGNTLDTKINNFISNNDVRPDLKDLLHAIRLAANMAAHNIMPNQLYDPENTLNFFKTINRACSEIYGSA